MILIFMVNSEEQLAKQIAITRAVSLVWSVTETVFFSQLSSAVYFAAFSTQ